MKNKKKHKININPKVIFGALKYYAVGLYKKADEDHMWIMASSISFNLLICAIPFTLILFSLVGIYLNNESTLKGIEFYLNRTFALSPDLKDKFHMVIFSKISEITENRTTTALIGIVGMLWTASGLFSTIRDVLNRIFKLKVEIFYLWGKLKDIGMVFLSTIFFLLSVMSSVIFQLIKSIDEQYLSNTLAKYGMFKTVIPFLLGLIFSYMMFHIIYKLVPQGRIKNRIVLISSITSTILWELLKIVFAIYLVHFSNLTAVYGAYGAIAAIIFLLYYSSFVFALGAEIGQLYNEKQLLPKIE